MKPTTSAVLGCLFFASMSSAAFAEGSLALDPVSIWLGGYYANTEVDVAAYLAAIGNTDRALGRALADVTAGNPFFLIEVVRHVEALVVRAADGEQIYNYEVSRP